MFKPEDFKIPLEKELQIRIIEKEIDDCQDIDVLKKHLKECSKSLMNYQHLLGKACEHNLEAFMTDWLSTMGIDINSESNG